MTEPDDDTRDAFAYLGAGWAGFARRRFEPVPGETGRMRFRRDYLESLRAGAQAWAPDAGIGVGPAATWCVPQEERNSSFVRLERVFGADRLERRWSVRPVLHLANGSTIKLTEDRARLAGVSNDYLALDDEE